MDPIQGGASVEEPVQTDVTSEAGAEGEVATPEQEAELFFDATKVPPQLQPTFREMQAAWTKKTQEAAQGMKRWEEFGDPEEVYGFLQQFSSPDGTLQWFFNIADQLGLDREALIAQLSGEQPGNVPNVEENTELQADAPMTRREFQAWQQQQQMQQQQTQEDQEVDAALREVGVTDPEQEAMVLAAAYRQPAHLGYTERIKRGYAVVQKQLDSYAAGLADKSAAKNRNAPASLSGGGTPSGEAAPAKTLEEALARSRERINNRMREGGE